MVYYQHENLLPVININTVSLFTLQKLDFTITCTVCAHVHEHVYLYFRVGGSHSKFFRSLTLLSSS